MDRRSYNCIYLEGSLWSDVSAHSCTQLLLEGHVQFGWRLVLLSLLLLLQLTRANQVSSDEGHEVGNVARVQRGTRGAFLEQIRTCVICHFSRARISSSWNNSNWEINATQHKLKWDDTFRLYSNIFKMQYNKNFRKKQYHFQCE